MHFSHETSKQSYGVCMIVLPVIELLILGFTTFAAIINRGTLIGWMCTALVFWQVYSLIKFYKQHP